MKVLFRMKRGSPASKVVAATFSNRWRAASSLTKTNVITVQLGHIVNLRSFLDCRIPCVKSNKISLRRYLTLEGFCDNSISFFLFKSNLDD